MVLLSKDNENVLSCNHCARINNLRTLTIKDKKISLTLCENCWKNIATSINITYKYNRDMSFVVGDNPDRYLD